MTLKVDEIQNTSGGPVTLTDQYASKSWVAWNGTGTATITGSFNYSTLTDNGTGTYTLTLTNSMSNANYALTTDQHAATGGSLENYNRTNGGAKTSSVWSRGTGYTATLADLSDVMGVTHGDLA